MLKKLVCVVLALFMLFGIAACSDSAETPTAAATTEGTSTEASTEATVSAEATEYEFPDMTIVYSGCDTLEGLQGKILTEMKDNIEAATNGNVKFDINLTGTLFLQDQEYSATMAGNLDMCAGTIGNFAEYMPELGMFEMAYLFESLDHWKAWFSSDAWTAEVDKIAKEKGYRILSVYCFGTREVNLREDKKVTTREDLANIKMRVINNSSSLLMGEALGANPVGLAFSDLYLALQTGTVDGEENPVCNIKDVSLYEVTKSITKTDHLFGTGLMGINEEFWQSLSPELQQVIQEAVTTCCNDITDTTEEEREETEAFFISEGLSIYELTDEEMANYRKSVIEYYFSPAGDEFRAKWDMDLYNAVMDLAK